MHLAKVLRAGGNVLLLDEPTNDLDVETLRALEEALLNFPGCAVVISHDRWFLDRIATHILAFEGNSEVVWFEGNFQDYVEDLQRRRGEQAAQPHRLKYRQADAAESGAAEARVPLFIMSARLRGTRGRCADRSATLVASAIQEQHPCPSTSTAAIGCTTIRPAAWR